MEWWIATFHLRRSKTMARHSQEGCHYNDSQLPSYLMSPFRTPTATPQEEKEQRFVNPLPWKQLPWQDWEHVCSKKHQQSNYFLSTVIPACDWNARRHSKIFPAWCFPEPQLWIMLGGSSSGQAHINSVAWLDPWHWSLVSIKQQTTHPPSVPQNVWVLATGTEHKELWELSKSSLPA